MPLEIPAITAIEEDILGMSYWMSLRHDNLGADLLAFTTTAILAACDAQVDPDGQPWAPLSADYAAWKSRHAAGMPIGVLTGAMLDPSEIAGVQTIEDDEASMSYGTSEETRQEAEWFQEGSDPANWSRDQPPRPFYALNAEARAFADECLADHFKSRRLS